MPLTGSSSLRFTEGAVGTLRLLAYLAAALLLMVADHRAGWLDRVRQQADVLTGPLYWLAAAPARIAETLHDSFASRVHLNEENEHLRQALQLSNARLHRLEAVAQENDRLRELLDGTRGYRLSVQLTSILDIDLDPFRHRIMLDVGERDGVRAGQALIDAQGVVGQVIEVATRHATALLITDPDHAVPVQVARTGLRLIAYGTGQRDRLRIPNIPQSGDVRPGDQLMTSGIGGNYPAGFAVGEVVAIEPDETRLFAVAEVRPVAALDRSGEVLLVWNVPVETEIGPPAEMAVTEATAADAEAQR